MRNTEPKKKRNFSAVILILLMLGCQKVMADAVSYNEPRSDQSTILLSALSRLQALKSWPQLNSHFSDPKKTAYYLRDASFLGRTKTIQGLKNIIRVTFIRSSPYTEAKSSTPPPRGHSFVIIFSDDIEPECFISIPMPDAAVLKEDALVIDGSPFSLMSESIWRAFIPIKSK